MTKSIAIVGAGYMAEEHIRSFMALTELKVVGITSRTKVKAQKLAEKYDIEVVADDIATLYEATQADGVVVAVNELSVLSTVRKCILYPWRILCEKPLGLYIDETRAIVDEAKTCGAEIFIAMNRRHFSSTINALQSLEDDDGKRFVEVHDQENIISALQSGQPREVVSRWMVANSIHLVDYFTLFCRGKLNKITTSLPIDIKNPFFIQKVLHFSSGDVGVYTAIWNAPGPWGVKLTTPNQMMELKPLEQLEKQIFPEKKRYMISLDEIDNKFKPGLYRQGLEFKNVLNNNQHQLTSITSYLNSLSLVEKIYPESFDLSKFITE